MIPVADSMIVHSLVCRGANVLFDNPLCAASTDYVEALSANAVDCATMLGAQSSLVTDTAATAGKFAVLQSVWFQLAAVAVAVCYVVFMSRYGNIFVEAIKQCTSSFKLPREEDIERGQSAIYNGVFKWTLLIGIVLAALLAARVLGSILRQLEPQGGWTTTLAAVAVGLTLIYVYKYVAIRIIGFVAQEFEFAEVLLFYNNINVSIAVMCLSPLAVLALLAPAPYVGVLLALLAGGCAVALLLLLKDILILFMAKKVSILHCFLYLCAVEVFPISILTVYLSGSQM